MVKVIFLHPDLGIGGAERLIVDAAVALKRKNHTVSIYTTHHDKSHCFPETIDGTLDVHCYMDWMPRSIRGRLMALCVYLRMIFLALYIVCWLKPDWDIAVVDQVSACVPFLKRSKSKVLFYCHFPDQLLTQRKSHLKRAYRSGLDWFEEWSTSCADHVLVNSQFTASVYRKTFKTIRTPPTVLYPSLDFSKFDACATKPLSDFPGIPRNWDVLFLSINRFERKKNLHIALHAFSLLINGIVTRTHLDISEDETSEDEVTEDDMKFEPLPRLHLVMAGGYDKRNIENIQHYNELLELCSRLKIDSHVTFLKSPSEECKVNLLRSCDCLVYTPEGEHFGIVPLEAMYCGTPVIAANSGGPKETIVHRKTGFLCHNSDFYHFAANMLKFVRDRSLKKSMGTTARKRVVEKFSFASFTNNLDRLVNTLAHKKNQ